MAENPTSEELKQRVRELEQAESERNKLLAKLIQTQKLAAVGTLAAGIAHNFNNILMGLQGRASLMMMNKEPSHPDFKHLAEIQTYVKDAVALTKDLSDLARSGHYAVEPTELNALIQRVNRLFGRTKKEVQIRERQAEKLWPVEVDRGEFRQVLLNLYVNAWQAMPDGGELHVQTENVTLDEKIGQSFGAQPGRYVKISVTDTGNGMDEATRDKIFEPFFSTRDPGRSSGLGLTSVQAIVKKQGGFVDVASQRETGTSFHVYLPACDREIVKEGGRAGEADVPAGGGTILLVDDDDMILEVGRGMLEKLGYEVLTANSGLDALDLYAKQRGKADLVILDMIMPDMGGGETFDRLAALDGNVKVLLSSGYSSDGQANEIMDRGCAGFIQKPFSFNDLSNKVRKALET